LFSTNQSCSQSYYTAGSILPWVKLPERMFLYQIYFFFRLDVPDTGPNLLRSQSETDVRETSKHDAHSSPHPPRISFTNKYSEFIYH